MVEVLYRNPAVTSDVIVPKGKNILLIKRKGEPFKGMWALPGGHINYGLETLEKAATRELEEETTLRVKESDLELLGVYSEPNRDPRDHYITHVYVAKNFEGTPKPKDDAKAVRWFPLNKTPPLAFDHDKILNDYRKIRKC